MLFRSPAEFIKIPQQSLSMESPAELSSKPQRSISSHRVIPFRVFSPASLFPNRVIFSYRFILATIIPSGNEELYSSTSAQDSTNSRHSSRIYFPRQEYIHKHHIFIHYSMHTHHTPQISFILENILISCSSYIMTLHTTKLCLFRKRSIKR